MEKYNNFINNLVKAIEGGMIYSKDFKKELENVLKFKLEEMLAKLNLVTREEFEVQKKLIEKLQKNLDKKKNKTKKRFKKKTK